MTYQILMIEDDEQICEVVKDYFTRESENEIVVRTAQNGQDGLDLFETERVDLVLLDIMLPGMDGFAICREMRRTSMVPILFLTARSSERDILLGYDLGCDDYIIKPFSLVTLYAKCKALIRRSKDLSRTGELVCGRIHMKPSEYRVLVDSQEIELAPKEFALLRMLLENKNKTVARERLLIGVWGSGRKEYAAMKLTLMLMGGSALLLVGILGIYFNSGATSMNILDIARQHIPDELQRWFFPLTFIGFGVLGALFPFHTWSPDGHASAPTAVSMLHAGVLMKLGGYGCFRVAICLMPEAAKELSWIFIILTGISVVYGAYSAIVQTDLKYINAYSSVSHCGLVLFAILMLNQTAVTGAIMQMLSHGLMTALFFALIGMIYGRTHTRDIREMGGLMKIIPFLGACYVIAGLASLGLPGLSGFVAEMTIFVGSFQHADVFHRVMTILACTSIVITAVYILRVVGKLLYGKVVDEHHLQLTDAVWYERFSAIVLILAIAGIGLAPLWISDMIRESLNGLWPF